MGDKKKGYANIKNFKKKDQLQVPLGCTKNNFTFQRSGKNVNMYFLKDAPYNGYYDNATSDYIAVIRNPFLGNGINILNMNGTQIESAFDANLLFR